MIIQTRKFFVNTGRNIIKVRNIDRIAGRLFTYGHFFHDCLMPEVNLGLLNYTKIYRLNTIDQRIGVFSEIYKLFGVETIEVNPEKFAKIECDLKNVSAYNCNGFKQHHIIKLKNFVESKLNVTAEVGVDIVLIKRGFQKLLKNIHIDTGGMLREISQIDVLEKKLKNNGFDVKTVVLEDINWESQVKLFKSAKLVIGAHGAGLCNIAFCDKGTDILEVNFSKCKTFSRISNLVGLNYHLVDDSVANIINLVKKIKKR